MFDINEPMTSIAELAAPLRQRHDELDRLQSELQHQTQRQNKRGAPREPAGLFELRMHAPLLSRDFTCSDADASALCMAFHAQRDQLCAGGGHSGGVGGDVHREETVLQLEAETRRLSAKLNRKDEECESLKDEIARSWARVKAVETQSKQTASVLSRRRDEMRKQLLTEEGRSARHQHQNKLLQQEVDRLKGMLSTKMR